MVVSPLLVIYALMMEANFQFGVATYLQNLG